jgi:AcrR family transcriptional regulator
VGNREALLQGAKDCLRDKGYARTTARDIATAAGTSLAAIGYHYRSTEALLGAAMIDAIEEWSAQHADTFAVDLPASTPPGARFEALMTRILASFDEHRPLWAGSVESLAQADRLMEVREAVARGLELGRTGLTALVLGVGEDDLDPQVIRSLGSLLQAVVTGVIVQRLVDPERAPEATDLRLAVEQIAGW